MDRGKPENPEKNNNKLNPHTTPSPGIEPGNIMGSECSHHCDIPAPLFSKYLTFRNVSISIGVLDGVYVDRLPKAPLKSHSTTNE